jgi:hypothetical protein
MFWLEELVYSAVTSKGARIWNVVAGGAVSRVLDRPHVESDRNSSYSPPPPPPRESGHRGESKTRQAGSGKKDGENPPGRNGEKGARGVGIMGGYVLQRCIHNRYIEKEEKMRKHYKEIWMRESNVF